jgi:hypothetical protein
MCVVTALMHGIESRPMQRNWIIMQIVLIVLVAAGMIIAATKLWL